MVRNKVNIEEIDKISCLQNGITVSIDKLDDAIVQLKFLCSTNLIVITSASLLSVVIVAQVISVFLYRYRWSIRYCLIKSGIGGTKVGHILDDNENIKYDAFVSYEEHDRGWVRDNIIPKLEQCHQDSTTPLLTEE